MARTKKPADPWMKFYPSDWRSDPALRSCSLAARGLWVECMCIMHEADPYGHLTVNGRPVTDASLAVLVGCLPEQLLELLDELESAGVFSRNGDGVIYSRRMTRDNKRRITARKNGSKGGNKALSDPPARDGKQKENRPPDNPKDNPRVNPEVKHKEARSQIPEKKETTTSGSKPVKAAARDPDPPDEEPPRRQAWSVVAEQVRAIAGLSDRPMDFGIVAQWLADFGEEAIVAGVEIVVGRPAYDPDKVRSARFFEPSIAEEAKRLADAKYARARQNVAGYRDEDWMTWMANWATGKRWYEFEHGPPPNRPDTLVPERLLARYRERFGSLEPGLATAGAAA